MKALDPFEIDLYNTTLIEASAGTGKTYTITTLYCRLIAKGFSAESLLVVTFTEAAAAELKLRIRQRLAFTLQRLQKSIDKNKANENQLNGDDDDLVRFLREDKNQAVLRQRFSLALISFDQASILTIHSFCLKILKENAFDSRFPFDIQLMPDRSVYLNQACIDFFSGHVNHQDPLFLKYLDSRNITPDSFVKSFGSVVSRKGLAFKPEKAHFTDFFNDYRKELKKIQDILCKKSQEIIQLFLSHPGVDRRSYSKKNVPIWLENTQIKIEKEGADTLFVFKEKGDALYKFTQSRINQKVKKGNEAPSHDFFDACQHLLELSLGFENNLIHLKLSFLQFFNQALEKIKTDQGICFFDDLVNELSNALNKKDAHNLKKAVRNTYHACLIDEFQDTDPVQYDIFSNLFATPQTPFFMIGDPKQAIYAFRGGDIFAYLTAAKNSTQQFTLLQNYRSAPLMVEGVNEVFSNTPNPFLYEQIGFSKVTTPDATYDRLFKNKAAIPPLQFKFVKRSEPDVTGTNAAGSYIGRDGYIIKKSADNMIPDLVANDISALLESALRLRKNIDFEYQTINPEDIAVLVRTNDQAQKIHQALTDRNIPAYLSKSGSVFDSSEAIDLHDILCAVNSPDSNGLIKAALCTTPFSFSAEQIALLGKDEDRMFQWQNLFREYKNLWEIQGFVSMIMTLFHSDRAFLRENSGLDERKLTNFYHLVELISQADIIHDLSPFYLIKWYVRQLSKDFRDESADELRLESDKKAIAIVTIHKSKGLEYPVVYLPYLWEGQIKKSNDNIVFHDPNNTHALTLDIGSNNIEESKNFLLQEEDAEQRRLLYVALTRASSMCKIFWGGFKNVQNSALGSLLHLNDCRDDETMLGDLNSLKLKSKQSISIETFDLKLYDENRMGSPESHPSETRRSEASIEDLSKKNFSRKVQLDWRMSSFSAITKNIHHTGATIQKDIPDNKDAKRIGLAQFPKGARAGDAFHKIFETIDFSGKNNEIVQSIKTIFEEFGFSGEALISSGWTAIENILKTRLETGNTSFHLKDIKIDQRKNEMEFSFPVKSFKISFLQKVLEMSNSAYKTNGYIKNLSSLKPLKINGFIKGFIDLVICHEGKWYIIDYKTNFLGDTYDAYDSEQIHNAMAEHHYFLQYHIYLAALHRYLKLRLKDYEYHTHFGGVFYLFLRGMHPDYGSGFGVFFDKPKQKAIRYLSDNL